MRLRHALTIPSLAVAAACGQEAATSGAPADVLHRPAVTEEGARIAFPGRSPGLKQLVTSAVRRGATVVALSAPARVVASIATSVSSRDHVVLFESADATSTWSQYREARVTVDRTSRVLDRVREMYQNLGATARELMEAETDAATARANEAEHESHMRALGFNPAELDAVTANVAWLMAEVPEAELHNVQRGGSVLVRFTSYPDQPETGRAEALGDVVDPVTRTVKVRVSVPNPQRRFLPGMFARVTFGDPRQRVLVVPVSAVVTVEERSYVFVQVAPGEFRRKEVTLQPASADSVIVLAGLSDGDQVVTAGAMLLKGLSFGY